MKRLSEFAEHETPRFDTVASTGGYPLFESIASRRKVKRFFCYYNGIDNFRKGAKIRVERTISNIDNISNVFIPIANKPWYGYGDVKGTTDAILFVFSFDTQSMELFIARGRKHNQKQLYNLLYDGELNAEMDWLRETAKTLIE